MRPYGSRSPPSRNRTRHQRKRQTYYGFRYCRQLSLSSLSFFLALLEYETEFHICNRKPIDETVGTTVLGAIDPLDDIADLCHEFGIWMHVDAAWGGGILMSLKYRPLLKGIERYNFSNPALFSQNLNLGIFLTCSICSVDLIPWRGIRTNCSLCPSNAPHFSYAIKTCCFKPTRHQPFISSSRTNSTTPNGMLETNIFNAAAERTFSNSGSCGKLR